MALKFLDYCKDSTQTSGTGSLTLDDSGAAGWQTLKDAVDRGLVANGDTVRYYIRDTSDPVLFEEGVGVVGSGGLSLTRPSGSVRQSSSGTSLISWPSGGARDVILGISPGDFPLVSNNGTEFNAATFATNLGLPRLAAANTFADRQIIDRSGTTGLLDIGSDLAAGVCGRLDFFGHDSGGVDEDYARISASITDATAGNEDGDLLFQTIVAGVLATRAQIQAGVFKDGSGNKYDAFPSGFTMQAQSVPPGWVRSDVTGERLPKLAGAADTAGATGGSWTVSGLSGSTTVNAHTLTTAELSSHQHPVAYDDQVVQSGTGVTVIKRVAIPTTYNTDFAGGGNSHSHTASTSVSSSGSWRPAYEIWLKIVKS